jgi:hypothetical protein
MNFLLQLQILLKMYELIVMDSNFYSKYHFNLLNPQQILARFTRPKASSISSSPIVQSSDQYQKGNCAEVEIYRIQDEVNSNQ